MTVSLVSYYMANVLEHFDLPGFRGEDTSHGDLVGMGFHPIFRSLNYYLDIAVLEHKNNIGAPIIY